MRGTVERSGVKGRKRVSGKQPEKGMARKIGKIKNRGGGGRERIEGGS